MRKIRKAVILAGLLFLIFLLTSGGFLVVNNPQKADVLVVLAGETDHRPARGLELLREGYSRRMILDVPAHATIYQWKQTELGEKYIQTLPERAEISICPIYGLSTKAEAKDVGGCLESLHAKRVLLVTSDYHTCRGLSVFRREVPNYDYSIAAAYDPEQFSSQWWRRRQWAKVNFDEWIRLVWWELIDRWR